MAIREIELLGSSVLRDEAQPVETFDAELERLVEDMFETMYFAKGAGLAAPQVGISLQILVIDATEEEGESALFALINPRIVESSRETDKATEGCLSIPGVEEVVKRPAFVTVEGFNPQGDTVRIENAGDLLGRVLQHEIDHLEGVLFIDRITPLKRRMLLKKYHKQQEEETAT